MVKATKIDDEGNLGRWLEGQPREVSIWIAHRVAMRVAPIGWAYPFIGQHEGDLTTLPVLRCNLISGVESILPNSAETTAHAARSANYAATRAIRPGVKATGAATEAAISAIGTHTSVAHTSAAAADYAASAAHAAAAAGHASTAEAFAAAVNIWLEVRTDALAVENAIDSTGSGNSSAYLPIGLRLWSGGNPLERFWTQTRDKWASRGPGWQFWIRWYEDALAGREPDWALLEKVALIGNEVWEAGAEAVNARIGELLREAADGRQDDEDGLTRTAGQALDQNAKIVVQQLGVLRAFVTEEIDRLRGRNSFYSSAEQEAHSGRVAQLTTIVEAVVLMEEALEDAASGHSTALTVIEAQLPQVVDAAEAAVAAGGAPAVSAAVVMMAATIKYLTDHGANNTLASGYAFAEMCWGKMASWRKGK